MMALFWLCVALLALCATLLPVALWLGDWLSAFTFATSAVVYAIGAHVSREVARG